MPDVRSRQSLRLELTSMGQCVTSATERAKHQVNPMVLKGVYDSTSEIENGWIVFVVATIAAGPSASQDLVPPLYVAPTVPSVAGLAFGRAPQFIGADEYITGPAPILRFQQPGSTRAVALLGTVFSANILDHPVLRTGPTGVYRLGRSDVDDEVVARLPEIDASIDLGWTLGAEYIDPETPLAGSEPTSISAQS